MSLARLTAATFLTFAAFVPLLRAAEDQITVRGSVTRLDTATGLLHVQTPDGKTQTFHVTKDTAVQIDGHSARLDEILAGQRVRVTYRPAGGRNQVTALTARKTTGQDVAREVREALQAVGQYTYQQKDEYERRLRTVLGDLDDRIDDLQQRAREATADARKRLDPQIRELQQKRSVVTEKLEKVKAAAPGAWDDLKTGIRKAVEDLQRALDEKPSDRPNP
jgi:chromosome segregation ATPase